MRIGVVILVLAVLSRSAPAQTPAAAIDVPQGTIVHHDLAYVSGGHERQVLDLYVPLPGQRPSPLILMIHGGGWRLNDKAQHPMVRWAIPVLSRAGFAVASINHRYSSHALFPAQIHDAKAALRWIRRNRDAYGVDPDRIGVWGASSGGHLASLLGTSAGVPAMDGETGGSSESVRVRAVVAWYPPIDFLEMASQRLPEGSIHDAPDSPESLLLGGPIQERRESALAASPLSYVSPDDAPFQVLHGDRDLQVPFQQSELLRDALAAVGVPIDFHVVPGAGHGTIAAFQTPEVANLMVQFFDRHLRGN